MVAILLYSKSNYEHSVQIIDAIKLIALQEWLKNNRFEMFSLFTSNNNLYLSLEECQII